MLIMADLFDKKFMKERAVFKWHRVFIFLGVVLLLFGFLLAVILIQAKDYNNKVAPGLHIGNVSVGGMTESQLKNFLHSMSDKLLSEGFHFLFNFIVSKKNFCYNQLLLQKTMLLSLCILILIVR